MGALVADMDSGSTEEKKVPGTLQARTKGMPTVTSVGSFL